MRRVVFLGNLLFLFCLDAAAQDIVIRTSVSPTEAWIGQRVHLSIDVLGSEGWAKFEKVGDLEISGTYVLRTESQGTRLNETIGGTSYTGQRYEVSLFCQRPGQVEVPPVSVDVVVKQWGVGAEDVSRKMMTKSASFLCKTPPGAEGIRGLISTTQLTATQNWSSQLDTVALGDAISRTVTLTANDVSSMAFPPMRHPELEGMSTYPGEPSVSDQVERGDLRGERIETVTYVCEKPGKITLPAITLPWWDLDAESLRHIELSGLDLVVTGELMPDSTAVATTVAVPVPLRDRLGLIAASALILVLAVRLGRGLARRIGAWQNRRRESEGAYFKHIAPALRSGDPASAVAAIMRWLDRLDLDERPALLNTFLQRHGDDNSRAGAQDLASCLAPGERFTDAHDLGKGLKRARKHLHQTRRQKKKAANVLPPLNQVPPSRP